jgi:hypothetical protein
MKLVKNFVFAVVLVSALAVNTFAGDQETPGFIPPPPPRVMSVEPNEVPNDGTPTEEKGESAFEYFFIEALNALLSVF